MSQFQPLNPPRFNYVEAHAEDRAFECAASYVHTLELKIIEAMQARVDEHLQDKVALGVALEETRARVEQLEKDAEVMRLLDSGEWKLTRILPLSCLTDEANAKYAWMVERQKPPYCNEAGVRFWQGPTAHETLSRAIADMKGQQP